MRDYGVSTEANLAADNTQRIQWDILWSGDNNKQFIDGNNCHSNRSHSPPSFRKKCFCDCVGNGRHENFSLINVRYLFDFEVCENKGFIKQTNENFQLNELSSKFVFINNSLCVEHKTNPSLRKSHAALCRDRVRGLIKTILLPLP